MIGSYDLSVFFVFQIKAQERGETGAAHDEHQQITCEKEVAAISKEREAILFISRNSWGRRDIKAQVVRLDVGNLYGLGAGNAFFAQHLDLKSPFRAAWRDTKSIQFELDRGRLSGSDHKHEQDDSHGLSLSIGGPR